MSAYLKMDDVDRRHRLDQMAQGIIGTPLDRPEGPLKVTGAAPYAHEWHARGLCHGVLVRAPALKGRVRGIDADWVKSMPGILAVVQDERLLRNPAQGKANEAPIQGATHVAYFGQPVAVVVAETFEQARHGAQQLGVDIEVEDGHVCPEDGAPVERPEGKQSKTGDLEQAMAEADFAIDQTYRTPVHSSAPMEPHASIAEWNGDELTLHGSYQMLQFNRNELADSLGVDPEKVRIVSPYVGGGFGSKLGIAPEAVAAAIAAQQLARPVAVAMTRQQVFEATMRRSETRQRIRLAADRQGRLTGIGHEVLVSNLPGEDFVEPVTQATPFSYSGENRVVSIELARVHRTCAGSVRAPGEAVGVTALETAMDELATLSGIDPVVLRKVNLPERDPTSNIPFSSHGLAEALDSGAKLFGWDRRSSVPGTQREGEWLVGIGMSSGFRVNLLMEAKARVRLEPEGTAVVESDMTDIGTGTYAILTQIAAEMLGLPADAVETRLGDTRLPPGPGSGGSWGASSTGSAVLLACEDIRRQLADQLGCSENELVLKDGYAITGNRKLALKQVLSGHSLVGEGHLEPGNAIERVRQASYGAYFCEVAVSSVTGEARIRRLLGVFSAGRILNAKTARSQCIGGMIFGIGMALTEELVFDCRDGHVVNRDLAEYHIPVNADVPQIDVVLLEERDNWACPLQSKGIGELGICGAAAAINNAIYNACGVRVRDYPVSIDKILAGFDA